ncbi:hypothetical protein AW02_007960 [Bacillus velezensis NJN-6]|nr:hypothetical protein AW02_007960 [Bacillus velezensis NJN-6]
MNVKYTMSQAEIVEAIVEWLNRKGYTATGGKFICNSWDQKVRAEFTLRKN